MTETKKFQTWLKLALGHEAVVESMVEQDMNPKNLRIEGKWTEIQ